MKNADTFYHFHYYRAVCCNIVGNGQDKNSSRLRVTYLSSYKKVEAATTL